MDVEIFLTALFCSLAGLIVGYWLTYRDRSHEENTRGKLKKENHDLRRTLQTSEIALGSLEEKFGRQRGQLNVLQQLCDDWSSSRETTERERAQIEVDLNTKSSRISEVENEFRDEKSKRIALEDQVHKLAQELLTTKSNVEEQWRGKHAEVESTLNQRIVDLNSIKNDRQQVSQRLHDANARIAELESEIVSSKSMIETATSNATGLKQEYVSLETGLKTTNDQLKRAQADYAKAISQKEAAIKAAADTEKQLAVLEKQSETLADQCGTLQQKLESMQATLTKTQEQLARVTEQRDQAMEFEKASGVVSSGLQKRLDNQESTIHMLRQSQDDALENLKHELQVRTELEARFDVRAESIREDAEKVRCDYEAQIVSLREGAEKTQSDYEALREGAQKTQSGFETQIEALREGAQKTQSDFETQIEKLREDAEKTRSDYEAQIEALRSKADGAKTEHAAKYETQLKELREQLARQAAQYAEHSRDLRAQLKQQKDEFVPLTTRCSTLESEATTYTESIVKLDAKREQLQQQLDSARKQMQSQLKQDSETIGELQRERIELRKELDELHLQMLPLQENVDKHRTFTTELAMSQARVVELERSNAQRDQETKRLHAQANELERLRDRYQEARQRKDSLQMQLDEMVARQISSESDRATLVARISELEARLGASLETTADLRKERALVLATLADQRSIQEPEATIISFTQSMETQPEPVSDEDYDSEYGGRVRRDANRGLVFTEAPESCDDLKRISGIAEVLEKRLNDFGIYTFRQIMEWKPEEIEEFSRLLAFRDRIVRDDWQGQARFFYNQKRKSVRAVA